MWPKIDIWGCRPSIWPSYGHFGPFLAPQWVIYAPNSASTIYFLLGIDVLLTIFVLKSISGAGGPPVMDISGHFRPFPAPKWVRYAPDRATIVHFILGINVALTICALKSIFEAADAPDGQVLAVPGPHVVRDGCHQNKNWSEFNFAATSKT